LNEWRVYPPEKRNAEESPTPIVNLVPCKPTPDGQNKQPLHG